MLVAKSDDFELDPWDVHGGRREPSLPSYSLTPHTCCGINIIKKCNRKF